jgi:hypothetical protein
VVLRGDELSDHRTLCLIGVLSEADRLIGTLAGESGRLPNPHVLRRPFVRRKTESGTKSGGLRYALRRVLTCGSAYSNRRASADEIANCQAKAAPSPASSPGFLLCVQNLYTPGKDPRWIVTLAVE